MSLLYLFLKNVEFEFCFYVLGNVCSLEYFLISIKC